MAENLKTVEFIAAQERLKKFTEKTESISLRAYYLWGYSDNSQEFKSPSNLLFDKCVREMFVQRNLIFSQNGALVIPNPKKNNQNSPLFHDMMTLISCNNTEKLAERIHKTTEIIYLDYKEKFHLVPVEIGDMDKWKDRLGITSTSFVNNPGFRLGRNIGIVLTEERRKMLEDNGELKKSYRKEIQENHPDVNKENYATILSQKINNAYSILSNPQKFIQYRNGR